MPLNPSDIRYINKLLDQHLKAQRSWAGSRYAVLAAGALAICIAVFLAFQVNSMAKNDFSFSPTTRHATTASTQPITREELDIRLDTVRMDNQINNMVDGMIGLQYMVSLAMFVVGLNQICVALAKWNRHRRDIILITLLREKCAAELSLPPAT